MITQHVNVMNLHTPRVRRRWWPMFLNWLLLLPVAAAAAGAGDAAAVVVVVVVVVCVTHR